METILILNGASGTGKTATAEALIPRLSSALWIHPDGLWNTPEMEPESILRLAIERALRDCGSRSAIIDCQIRPTSIAAVLAPLGVQCWIAVMHTCSRAVREERLLQRGWDTSSFRRIQTWSSLLLEESRDTGDILVDTSVLSTEAVCDTVVERLCARGYLDGAQG